MVLLQRTGEASVSFWRDVKRGWNVGSHTAGKAVRGLGEKLGLQGGSPEDAERRAALSEVEGWHRPPPSPVSPPAAAPASPDAAAAATRAPAVSPTPPATTPPPSSGDLSEPELEERIRRRTL